MNKVTLFNLKADGLLHSWDGRTLQPGQPGPTGVPVARITTASQDYLALTLSGTTSTDSTPGITIKTYAWDFGDGATASGPSVTHTYASPGTYAVRLTITDSAGSTASTVQTFAVQSQSTNRPPVPQLSVSANGLTVTVDATGSTDPDGTLVKIVMGYGDGGLDVSNSTDPGGLIYTRVHTYSAPGTYTCGLTVYDDAGKGTTTYQTIAVSANALAPQAVISNPVNSGATFSATAAGSSDPQGQTLTYAWDYGDGGQSSGATASHVYAANGPWTVVLTVTNTSGLTSQASVTASPQIGTNTPYVDDDGQGTANGQEPSGYTSYSTLSGASFFRRLAAAGGAVMSAAPGTYTLPGFGPSPITADTSVNPTAGFIGAGSAQTIVTMAPNSSSGAAYKAPKNSTDPYELARLTGTGALLQDFTLLGTPQTITNTDTSSPHTGDNAYGGLNLTGDNWTLRRVKVKGIPGNAQYPPGETFPISLFKAYGTVTLENVEIDGQGLSASNFATNGSGVSSSVPPTLLKVSKLYSHDNPYSGGVAFWQTVFDPASFIDDSTFDNCRCFWNIERCSGTVTVNRPRIGALQTKGAPATAIYCESGSAWGATDSQNFRWIIRDPRKKDGSPYVPGTPGCPKLQVQFGTAIGGGPNYYGRNNFKCYDAANNDISASFFSFTAGGYN
jgi:PKD repeat protein